jgi:hypothetical protein
VKFLYRLFVRLLVLVVLLLLLSLGYLHFYGFPDFLKQVLLNELNRLGYAAQFTSIRLDLFRGVVATDAKFADAKTPDQPLAQIDELELQFSVKRLMRKQTFLRAIHIANAVIAIPTPADENGPAKFTAMDAYATFQFEDDGSIRIDRLTGVYCGIRLNVSGRIKPRSATPTTQAATTGPGGGGQFLFLTKAVRELNQIQVTLPPQLDLDFDLDLAQPLAGHVLAKLRGNQLQYRNLQLDSAGVDIEMSGGAIELRRCEASLYGGEIDINGRYDLAMGQFDMTLSSTTDPAAIVPLFVKEAGPILRNLRVEENPKILARYRLSPETGSLPELTGTVQTGGLTFQGVEFRSIKFAFEDRGPQVKFNGVEVVTPEGRLDGHGEYHLESSDFAYEFDSTLDPTKLLPLMINSSVRQIVEPAWFETPPHIVAKVTGDFVGDPDAFAYDARIDARRCSYRGVGLESASARLRLRESRLNVQDLQLERREGVVHGTLFADFNRHRVNFDLGVRANPSEIVGLLGEKAVKVMAPYRFGPRTDANTRGVVDFDSPTGTVWTARVVNEGFSYWKFTADRAQATLVFTNNTMQINDFDADFYSGKLRGHAGFVFSDADPSYNFEFSVDRADVHSVLGAVEDRDSTVTGLLTGQATITGRGNDLAALSGKGQLNVMDGVLWQAPVFGIFSEVLGKTKATRAQASFTITNQAVSTDDMQIAAGAFTAQSRGQLGFDGKLDFRVEAQFLRAWPGIGWISPIIGKLLEYKVGGTIGDPKYRPVNLPKELLPNR